MKKIIKLLAAAVALIVLTAAAALSASAACGEDAPWSEWSETKPAQTDTMALEDAVFYSFRTKETTASTSASLDGWTQNGSSVSYGDWKDASWTKTKPTESDTLRISNTRTVTDTAAYYTYTYFRYVSSDGKTAAFDKRTGWTYQTITLNYELAKKGNTSNGTHPAYYGPYAGQYGTYLQNIWYRNDSTYKKYHAAVTHTEWFYQTRTKTTTYNYYKWSDWSDYSQTVQTASDTKEVTTKTMYRYRYTAHDLAEKRVLAQPTCTAEGTYVRACRNCGEIVYFSIPKTGHSYKAKVTKKPTCVETGIKTYTCGVCGKKVTKKLAVVDHTYKTAVTKATTAKSGSVKSKCAVCGKVASSKTIRRIKTLKLSKTAFLVNGKVRKPTVIVKNTAGKAVAAKYYTVTYSNAKSKAVGTYTVTVKFKGLYAGTKELTYKITKPAKVTGIEQIHETGIYFRWNKVTGAEGYEIFISPANANTFKKVAAQANNRLKNSGLRTDIKVKIRAYVVVNSKKVYGEFSKTVVLKPVK